MKTKRQDFLHKIHSKVFGDKKPEDLGLIASSFAILEGIKSTYPNKPASLGGFEYEFSERRGWTIAVTHFQENEFLITVTATDHRGSYTKFVRGFSFSELHEGFILFCELTRES